MSQKIREAFAKELAKDETQLDLACAALLIAGYVTQTAELKAYLDLLDKIAQGAQSSIRATKTDLGLVEALNRYLFTELNFYGNSADYYHPDNSFLNRVLELKTGIPISLSIVYLEVGWRLGLPLWGIGLPGHFIVGYGLSDDPIYIDVFNQGRILSEDDCLAICHVPPAGYVGFREEFLRPMTKKAILFRMLVNLKQIYVRQENWVTAYKTVDLMVIVRPKEITEIRDRGLLAYRLDKLQEAIFDIKRYLFLASDSIDASWLERRLETMEDRLLRLN
jgi:regulator of sirC expression with transglutaminase-like and TPR domain